MTSGLGWDLCQCPLVSLQCLSMSSGKKVIVGLILGTDISMRFDSVMDDRFFLIDTQFLKLVVETTVHYGHRVVFLE